MGGVWFGSIDSRTGGADVTQRRDTATGLSAVLMGALVAHLALEQTESPLGWLAVLALGLGPVGAAFFTRDIGLKKTTSSFWVSPLMLRC